MAKPKPAPVCASPVAAMTYAEGLALSQDARIIRIKVEADSHQRAYVAIAKLYRIIDANLPKGKFINSTLENAGIKPGTISNASYGARCFDLVEQGHLTEAEFDQLNFVEMSLVARIITDKSKKKLTPEQAVAIVRGGGNFAADLEAIYTTGMTAAEKSVIEEKVKADKAAAEAEAKAKAEAQAAELAEVKKRNAELAKANADMAAQAAAAPATPAPATPAPATDVATTPAPATDVAATPAPATDVAATADELIALLDEIEASLALLDAEGQGRVGARLCELASSFVESGVTAKPAKPAKASKKVA